MRSETQASAIAQPTAQVVSNSKKRLWAGRIFSALAILFLLFDSVGHLTMPAPVVEAFLRLGYPATLGFGLGILGLFCTILYAIPRSSIFGAILLTGYLGGATAANLRVSDPVFETLFPIILGVVIWAGIFLREQRLGKLVPLRS